MPLWALEFECDLIHFVVASNGVERHSWTSKEVLSVTHGDETHETRMMDVARGWLLQAAAARCS